MNTQVIVVCVAQLFCPLMAAICICVICASKSDENLSLSVTLIVRHSPVTLAEVAVYWNEQNKHCID